MSSDQVESHPVEQPTDTEGLVSVRISTEGKSVTLSSISKWRRAVQLGDLAPDTLVDVDRSSGREASQRARDVPELADIFEAYGFKLEAEPMEAVVEQVVAVPEPIVATTALKLVPEDASLGPFPIERTPPLVLPVAPPQDIPSAPPEKLNTWSEVLAVGKLDPIPLRPDQVKWTGGNKPLRARALRRDARRVAATSIGAVSMLWWLGTIDHPALPLMVTGVLSYWVWPKRNREAYRTLKSQVEKAKTEWELILKQWISTASSEAFDRLHAQISSAHNDLEGVEGRRKKALTELDDRSLQMREHLAKFPVDHTRISGVGQARANTLRANGFRTAADITSAVERLPGFGPSTSANLRVWRSICERSFVHNTRRSQDPAEIRRVDSRFSAERERLSKPMFGAAKRLYEVRLSTIATRSSLMPKLVSAWDQYNHLKLQLRAL